MIIPKGYKLVPVEPTVEMLEAGHREHVKSPANANPYHKYAAMLAAAPAQPQPIYDEAKERELFEVFMDLEHPQTTLRCWGEIQGCNGCGDYEDDEASKIWEGWLACAKSRAKAGEIVHE